MNQFKSVALATLTVLSVLSCKKEINNSISNDSKGPGKNPIPSEKAVSVVWGIGGSNRVYRWNGSSWDEPNPAAGLKTVSVGQDNSGAVWGLGTDNRVYRWNTVTNTWDEPAPGFGLTQITAYSANVVWGIGTTNNALYRSTNGGLTWALQTKSGIPIYGGAQNLISISTMTGGSLVAITESYKAYKLSSTSPTASWTPITLPSSQPNFRSISGSPTTCWAVGIDNKVYRFTGSAWVQPNPAAGLYSLSMSDEEVVWGIGGSNRVYKWNAISNSWDEPNPAAGLYSVSSGN